MIIYLTNSDNNNIGLFILSIILFFNKVICEYK